jgi:hypothetical protein
MDLILCAKDIFERQQDPQFGPVWNGRQIRNAFQSAVALAGFHAKSGDLIKLDKKFFKQVFEVSDQFSSYVWTVKQRNSDSQWATMNMVRSDHWTYPGAPILGTGQTLQTNPPGHPGRFGGQSSQTSRFGAFPQSTFGQAIPRSTTPFGGMSGQVPANNQAHMFGTMQTGQNQWSTGIPSMPVQFMPPAGNSGIIASQNPPGPQPIPNRPATFGNQFGQQISPDILHQMQQMNLGNIYGPQQLAGQTGQQMSSGHDAEQLDRSGPSL